MTPACSADVLAAWTLDTLLAATARVRGLATVSRNERVFDGIGIPMVNLRWPVAADRNVLREGRRSLPFHRLLDNLGVDQTLTHEALWIGIF